MINAASHQGTASSLEKSVDIVTPQRVTNQGIQASSSEFRQILRAGGAA